MSEEIEFIGEIVRLVTDLDDLLFAGLVGVLCLVVGFAAGTRRRIDDALDDDQPSTKR